jgi:flagellar FliJ protein
MSNLSAITLAIELAGKRRDDAAKSVALALQRVSFADEQMQQLRGYAGDTDARWLGAPPGMLSSELIKHHYQFVDRLHQAIGLQAVAIADANVQVDRARRALVTAEVRLAGLKLVLETRRAVVSRAQQRREQRNTDEFASLAFIRKTTQLSEGELV